MKSRHNNKYLLGLCIRGENAESQEVIRANLRDTLTQLREFLIAKKIKEFSIAKSPYIENIPWIDVLKLVKTIFGNNSIKIIICEGTLQYVTENRRDEIFKELHASQIGGHSGVSKTYNRIRQNFYWENMKQDIQRRIQQCIRCQLKKLVRLKRKEPMVITDTPGTVFEKIALDIVGPRPKTKDNNEFILTLQDQLSKFSIAVPLQNALATTIVDAFIKKFICIFGAPKVILTD